MRIFEQLELQFILNEIEGDITRRDTSMRRVVTARRRLAILPYYLSSTAEYRTIANLFGVSKSFVCNCVKEVSSVIVQKLQSRFIAIAQGGELDEVMRIDNDKWQFPMCAGAIDGTHIPKAIGIVSSSHSSINLSVASSAQFTPRLIFLLFVFFYLLAATTVSSA